MITTIELLGDGPCVCAYDSWEALKREYNLTSAQLFELQSNEYFEMPGSGATIWILSEASTSIPVAMYSIDSATTKYVNLELPSGE